MFTKRHEQELSEIKALTYELRVRFEEIVRELGRIQEAQDQLAAQAQAVAATGARESATAEAATKPRTKAKGGSGKQRGGRQRLPLAEATQSPDSHEG